MNPKRLYLVLIGVVVLLFAGLLVGTYGTNQLLATQASKLTARKAKSMALSQEQLGLNQAKEEVKKYASLEQISQAIVPEDKNQAETVREIADLAAKNSVTLAAINFPASTLGTSAAPTTAATSSAASSTTAAGSANSPLNALSQLLPVKNIPGVYELLITVQGDANKPVQYSAFLGFLTALEHNRRTAQISAINITPSASNTKLLTFTLNLTEYIKP